jgi:hypothetical protein
MLLILGLLMELVILYHCGAGDDMPQHHLVTPSVKSYHPYLTMVTLLILPADFSISGHYRFPVFHEARRTEDQHCHNRTSGSINLYSSLFLVHLHILTTSIESPHLESKEDYSPEATTGVTQRHLCQTVS